MPVPRNETGKSAHPPSVGVRSAATILRASAKWLPSDHCRARRASFPTTFLASRAASAPGRFETITQVRGLTPADATRLANFRRTREERETLNGEAHELEERIAANVAAIMERAIR